MTLRVYLDPITNQNPLARYVANLRINSEAAEFLTISVNFLVPIGGNGVVDSTVKDGAYALDRENIRLSGLIDPQNLKKIDIDIEKLGETLKTFGEWVIFIIEHISGQLLAVLRISDGPDYIVIVPAKALCKDFETFTQIEKPMSLMNFVQKECNEWQNMNERVVAITSPPNSIDNVCTVPKLYIMSEDFVKVSARWV